MPFLPILGAGLGLVGTGLSFFAQRSAASTAETFSALNAQSGVQQAQQQGAVAAMQGELESTRAQTESEAAFANAEALRAQTEADAAIEQENVRRGRDEFMRQLSAANAESGASGAVIATGSPLDVLMNAADQERQIEEGEQYGINARRVAGNRGAAVAGLQGRVAGSNASLYEIQSLAAVDEARTRAAQARLGGLAGKSQAAGMRASALGGLIGSVGSTATSTYNAFKKRY